MIKSGLSMKFSAVNENQIFENTVSSQQLKKIIEQPADNRSAFLALEANIWFY